MAILGTEGKETMSTGKWIASATLGTGKGNAILTAKWTAAATLVTEGKETLCLQQRVSQAHGSRHRGWKLLLVYIV